MLILGTADQIPGQLRIELFILGRNSRNSFSDESELISLGIDREVGFVSEPFNILAKNANAQPAQCPNGHPLRLTSSNQRPIYPSHLLSSLAPIGHADHHIDT